MSNEIIIACIAAGAALLGSLGTCAFSYLITIKHKKISRYKHRLIQAYEDIAAFHRLEEAYTQKLTTTQGSTAEAWKRNTRKLQASAGFRTPSKEATARNAEQQITGLNLNL